MKTPFDRLDPPPGGLQRLQARLDKPRRPPALAWAGGGLALAAVALAVGLSGGPQWVLVTPGATPSVDVSGLSAGVTPEPPVRVPQGLEGEMAIEREALADDQVVFYWVAHVEAGGAGAGGAGARGLGLE